jgi:hypothetical protein
MSSIGEFLTWLDEAVEQAESELRNQQANLRVLSAAIDASATVNPRLRSGRVSPAA